MRRRFCLVAMALLAAGCARWQAAGERPVLRAYVVHHGEPTWDQLFADFERETGIHVKRSYACRGTNLVDLAAKGGDGDLFITDSAANVAELADKGLSAGAPVRLGEITPILQVMKGNPKNIASLADLARPGVRIVLCFPRGCLGRVSDKILANGGLTEKAAPNIVKRVPGEEAVAKAVDGVNADVAIMWSWVLPIVGQERYDAVAIPPEVNVVDPMVAVLLKTGKNRAGAEKLVAFLQTDKAHTILADAKLAGRK